MNVLRSAQVFIFAFCASFLIQDLTIPESAFAQDPCGSFPSYTSPPSTQSRSITLSRYRIRFQIPDNYRTIGYEYAAAIFSPDSYRYYQCLVENQYPGGEWDVGVSIDNNVSSFSQLRNKFHGDLQNAEMVRVGQIQALRFTTSFSGTLERMYAVIAPCQCRIILISAGLISEEAADPALLMYVLRSFEFF